MPPRLMSTFCNTATVLSPEGLGIAGFPAVSVSGVNERPTPKPGNHVCSSVPPGTRSCFTTTAAPATAIHATSPSAAHETLRTTHKEHLPVSVTCYASATDHPPMTPVSLTSQHEPRGGDRPSAREPCEVDACGRRAPVSVAPRPLRRPGTRRELE